MNIDFHYGIVYIAARLGGLPVGQAQIVAHSCQYVDDATTTGVLHFAGGETFERFATAHKMFDYQNGNDGQNRLVWVPFHFLPAGVGASLDERALCRPNSVIAQEVVGHALKVRDKENSLHRLGVTLHTYVDTWAHQGFAGIESDYNRVARLKLENASKDGWIKGLERFVKRLEGEVESAFLSRVFPLGHGAALHYPDLPWIDWSYINGKQEKVERSNLGDFVTATDMACRVVQAYVADHVDFTSMTGLTQIQKDAIRNLLSENADEDEKKRLAVIMESVRNGLIPGIHEEIPTYIGKGVDSWKHRATGIVSDGDDGPKPTWTTDFERSNYRLFHDAVKEHRFVVTQEVLPKHGLRIA
jgi:hypothetical protein